MTQGIVRRSFSQAQATLSRRKLFPKSKHIHILFPLSQVTIQNGKQYQIILDTHLKGYLRISSDRKTQYFPISKMKSLISELDVNEFQSALIEKANLIHMQFQKQGFSEHQLPQFDFITKEHRGQVYEVFVMPKMLAAAHKHERFGGPHLNPFYGKSIEEVYQRLDSLVEEGKLERYVDDDYVKYRTIRKHKLYTTERGKIRSKFIYVVDPGQGQRDGTHPRVEMPHVDVIYCEKDYKKRLPLGRQVRKKKKDMTEEDWGEMTKALEVSIEKRSQYSKASQSNAANALFKEGLQMTGLVGSYNNTHPEHPVEERGAQGTKIGGVGNT
ncbi:MAG: hypothetical protein HRT90_11810, partial [Candidatus Margulisbacteria bacterium]|nr:hypothetical protein [Candidatus Margulisiibacteriota bacterium]